MICQNHSYVYGSIQDHGSFKGKVDLRRGRSQISPVEFEYAPGGEGSNHVIDPTNTNIVYSARFLWEFKSDRFGNWHEDKSIMPPVPRRCGKLERAVDGTFYYFPSQSTDNLSRNPIFTPINEHGGIMGKNKSRFNL